MRIRFKTLLFQKKLLKLIQDFFIKKNQLKDALVS